MGLKVLIVTLHKDMYKTEDLIKRWISILRFYNQNIEIFSSWLIDDPSKARISPMVVLSTRNKLKHYDAVIAIGDKVYDQIEDELNVFRMPYPTAKRDLSLEEEAEAVLRMIGYTTYFAQGTNYENQSLGYADLSPMLGEVSLRKN